jgi:hypothetical protein
VSPTLVDKPLTLEDWIKHARRFGGLQTVFQTAARSRGLDAAELLILASELRQLSTWRDRFRLSRDLKARLIELARETPA